LLLVSGVGHKRRRLVAERAGYSGEWYHCEQMVRAVNSLRRLGKEEALAVLKNHLRENDRYASPDQYWKLHLVCRLLFVNPQGWKFPRLGHAFPEIDWKVAEQLPQFPIALSHGVPFYFSGAMVREGTLATPPRNALSSARLFR